MKWLLTLLILLPSILQAQEYKVEHRCQGNNKHTMVVEYHDLYYVVVTPEYFQHNWTIRHLDGISFGGQGTLHYSTNATRSNQMEVNIISQSKWKYSGRTGAINVCREIVKGNSY
ncbi:hypothetical protein ACG2F4_00465 [Halalkalibaculum sp. DA3122]|uniref:hypothetical protein n=1 Tax=unclassified Halalkalibaculum TaxID=2964617 RepID=UPI003754462D